MSEYARFCVIANNEATSIGEAQRVVRGRGPAQSHGTDCQGTWEILLLPAGKNAGKGIASENNPDPGPTPGLHGDGSAHGEHEPGRRLRSRLAKSISRRTCGSRKS